MTLNLATKSGSIERVPSLSLQALFLISFKHFRLYLQNVYQKNVQSMQNMHTCNIVEITLLIV